VGVKTKSITNRYSRTYYWSKFC